MDGKSKNNAELMAHKTPISHKHCNSGSVGLVLNVLVLIVLLAYRPMRRRLTNVFIGNLAAIDTWVSLLVVLQHIVENDQRKHWMKPNSQGDKWLCKLWYSKMLLWGSLVSSAYGVAVLTFERYLGIVHTIWHRTSFTPSKVGTDALRISEKSIPNANESFRNCAPA